MTIVVQNRYFVRPGFEDEALSVRRNATAVRANAGKATGRILVTISDQTDAPTFIWECAYLNEESRFVDAAWADDSPEFTEVRHRMSQLLENFERHMFTVVSDTA